MHVFTNSANLDATLSGFLWILKLTGAAAVLALALGVLLAAMRVSPIPVLRLFGAAWVNIFRNTPLTLIIFFCYFGLYSALGLSISDDLNRNLYWLGVIGLSVYTAAFVCEAIRSGINTVPAGQAEAARAIGLTFLQTMNTIVLPQALRAVVPPLISVLIALAKNTSVAAVFGLADATFRMRGITNDNADDRIAIFVAFAIGYILIVEVLSAGASTLERRWRVAR